VDETGSNLPLQGPRPLHAISIAPGAIRNRYFDALRHDGAHNLSSISIRKDVLVGRTGYLREIQGATDRFMFYASAASGQGFLIDTSVLTQYRVHLDSAVHSYNDDRSVLNHYSRVFETSQVISTMLRDSPIGADFALELALGRVRWAAVDPGFSNGLHAEDLVRCFIFGVGTRDVEAFAWPLLRLLPRPSRKSVIQVVKQVRRGGRRL